MLFIFSNAEETMINILDMFDGDDIMQRTYLDFFITVTILKKYIYKVKARYFSLLLMHSCHFYYSFSCSKLR